jgi:3-oxoacyl-[acyl-carrier protein] reductase
MISSMSRIAVVGGGAGGIGRAVVLRLVEDGFFPVILDRQEKAAHEILDDLERRGKSGAFIALDLTRKAGVRDAFSTIASDHGRVDVLVNLAGGSLYNKPIQEFSLTEWQEVIDVNLKTTFLCCQAVIGIMTRQRQGAIVNTASNYGITGSAGRTPYSAAKAAIIAFSKSLALELAPVGIRVNVIAPGRTATARVMGYHSPESWAALSKEIPMGRAAEPGEIAEGVAFLAGDESGYTTGHTLHVNGGIVMP